MLHQFHRQTLPIMKIDRGQIPFREYVSTGTGSKVHSQGHMVIDLGVTLKGFIMWLGDTFDWLMTLVETQLVIFYFLIISIFFCT